MRKIKTDTLKGEIGPRYCRKVEGNLKVEKPLKVRQSAEQFLFTNPKGLIVKKIWRNNE